MSRLGYLARHPKRTLGTLGTLLVASGLVVGSGAFFTDTDSSVTNSATAAEFGISMVGSASASFDAYSCDNDSATTGDDCQDTALESTAGGDNTTFQISRLVPKDGRTYVRHFRIDNDGNVPAAVKLKAFAGAGSSGDLLAALETTVQRVDPAGSVTTLTGGDISTLEDVLTIGANDTQEYKITFEFPDTEVDQTALEDDAATLTLKAVANDENEGTPATVPAP